MRMPIDETRRKIRVTEVNKLPRQAVSVSQFLLDVQRHQIRPSVTRIA